MPATKNLVWIAALCVLGLVLYIATSEPEYTAVESGPAWVDRLAALEPAGVSTVTLSQGETRLELVRGAEGWTATTRYGYRADSKKVETLLEQLSLAASPERRGRSVMSHADFEVEPGKGIRLELAGSASGLPLALTLGKTESYDRVFVRWGDDTEVWSITPNLRYTAGLAGDLQLDPWLDLDILVIPEEQDITGFRIETESGAIQLRRVLEETTTPAPEGQTGEPATTATWQVVEPETFEADAGIVRGLRSSVRRIRATGAADPAKAAEYGLEPPLRTLTMTIADAEPVILEVGQTGTIDANREGRYARRRGDSRIFLLANHTADHLFKTLDQLKPAEPAPEPPPVPAPQPPP